MPPDPATPRAKKILFILVISVAIILSIVGWLRIRPDTSLEPMLPEHSDARQTVLFFRDSTFAEKAILWLRTKDPTKPADLFAAADAIEKQLDPSLITRVIRPPSESSAIEEAIALLDHAGELLTPADLTDLEAALTPDALGKRMRENYLQLTKPEGSFFQKIMQRDPLAISSRILARLYNLSQSTGYRVQVKDGRFINEDATQLMLILQTNTTATNMSSSEALVNHLNAIAAAAPPNITITPICGQLHTVQNAQLMQHDIHLAATVSTIAFIALFLLISRDFRVAAVFLMPLLTTALTIGLCALFVPTLSAMMIGLTLAMAGSAVDYGIFVYTAVRMAKNTPPQPDKLHQIRRPLIISHLTTLGVFVAFLFSEIPAYRQLGILTALSLILSLLAALFLLPKLLKPGGHITLLNRGPLLQPFGKKLRPLLIPAFLLLIAATYLATKNKFDPDVSRLDGVTPAVKQSEIDFQKSWNQNDTDLALLVVSAKTREAAEAANDQVLQLLAPKFSPSQLVSLSSLWPSAQTRAANQLRWQSFWSPTRIAEFKTNLAATAAPYNFSLTAFDPFLQTITAPPPTTRPEQLLSTIEEQFLARSKDGDYQMLNYFADTPENAATIHQILGDRPDVLLASRGVLNRAFQKSAASETYLLISIAALFIIASLLTLTRSLKKSLIILIPVATALIAMLAMLYIMALPMSIVTVISAIIVLALTSDYGVFALFACEHRETLLGQAMASMHLSFLTTIIGTAVLIFALHPALYMVGISLTAGLLAGYLTALLLIPALYFLRPTKTAEPT